LVSNILKIIFIIGKHIPHKIDLICNKYIKWNFISWRSYSILKFEICYQVAINLIGNCYVLWCIV
jgi:hypothetical protein